MDIKFAATSRPTHPRDAIAWFQATESLGYHRIGIADSPALYRDPWVSAALAALHTSRTTFGPWVTNPITRHPVVTASAAASVDDLAPGRLHIGIGTGNSGVYNAGHKASSVEALREYVTALRGLLEKGEAIYQGRACRLPWARRRIPIYIAATGAKTLRLAGEIADGAIIAAGTTPEVIQGAILAVEEGAKASGRALRDLDLWWGVQFNLYTDARDAADPQGGAAREANYLARFTLEGKFIPDEHKEGIRKLGAAYDLTTHGRPSAEQLARYDRLAQEYGVKEYLEQRFQGLRGTPEELTDRIKQWARLGVTQYNLNVPDVDRPERLRRFKEMVMGRL
ncbi:MAG: LLM class flavin-dependent oxidoreductase [SAR202 cluster bacterium]|nr:LLM class flavin-dependent oxidoreductase [SAR202 cluster bacterium]